MGVGERERAGYKGGSGDTNIRVPSFKIAEFMEYFLYLISYILILFFNVNIAKNSSESFSKQNIFKRPLKRELLDTIFYTCVKWRNGYQHSELRYSDDIQRKKGSISG